MNLRRVFFQAILNTVSQILIFRMRLRFIENI
jgi:hypothetical protein